MCGIKKTKRNLGETQRKDEKSKKEDFHGGKQFHRINFRNQKRKLFKIFVIQRPKLSKEKKIQEHFESEKNIPSASRFYKIKQKINHFKKLEDLRGSPKKIRQKIILHQSNLSSKIFRGKTNKRQKLFQLERNNTS